MKNCTSVLFQDHLLGGSPGCCLATQYRQQCRQVNWPDVACSEPACGRRSEWSSFSAVRFCAASHEISPLFMAVGWLGEEPDPFWKCKLRAQLECVVLCVSTSPSCFSSHSGERAQLCTASKCSCVNYPQPFTMLTGHWTHPVEICWQKQRLWLLDTFLEGIEGHRHASDLFPA